jgi:hypothetical protein
MTTTGEITTVRSEGWTVSLGTAIVRWGRRRAIRAELAAAQRANAGLERRADLEEQLLIQRELQAYRREMERATALQRLYRGP